MGVTGFMVNIGENEFMLDRLKAIFLCLKCNDLYLNSDNVLRREACLLARVRHLAHEKPLTVHVYTKCAVMSVK